MIEEWALLAEGAVQDARGGTTVVGINQNVHLAPELPTTTKRAIVAYLGLPDDVRPTEKFSAVLAVNGPGGDAVFVHSGEGVVGEKIWPDTPSSMSVMVEFPLTLHEYGRYEISVRVQVPHRPDFERVISFYVIKNSN
ncbi:hypothetical protein [Microbispora bryophytorum]|uniref:hypothetical protein n=1 Tax=Microbispora bryophytorum TaxID=1460882 RepID=UPI0033F87D3F